MAARESLARSTHPVEGVGVLGVGGWGVKKARTRLAGGLWTNGAAKGLHLSSAAPLPLSCRPPHPTGGGQAERPVGPVWCAVCARVWSCHWGRHSRGLLHAAGRPHRLLRLYATLPNPVLAPSHTCMSPLCHSVVRHSVVCPRTTSEPRHTSHEPHQNHIPT